MESLRRMAATRVRVLRGGEEAAIEARALVVGDVLVLAAGDAVGADARLLWTSRLETQEAALTGESVPVAKGAEPVVASAAVPDRTDVVFAGTHVAAGRGRAVVVATGTATEVGRIALLAESAVDGRTPLERRVAQLGTYLALAAVGVFAIVLAAGAARGLPLDRILMVAISQLVSTVPEGLPVAMTIALAVGMQRMAQRRAIVRRLAAVESLGSTTVICTDKTGTLTRNEMTVTRLWLPGGREIRVSGTGYAPEGRLLEGDRSVRADDDPGVKALLEAAALCSDAEVRLVAGRWESLGDPTEAALLVAAAKAGLDTAALRRRLPRRDEIPFSAEHKMMATRHDGPGGPVLFLKGAPERILELCAAERRGGVVGPMGEEERRSACDAAERFGGEALRVLAVADAPGTALAPGAGFGALRGSAVFLGLACEMDPPRPEAAEAVRVSRAAGIRTVLVTGDHRATGVAVARMLDIARDGEAALDGRDLDATPEPELARQLPRISVFARVQPEQKLRIVRALQASGEVVAMTGDGVNDAPALACADVGVAMGITGTEVAKEASEIVITDDDFATLVAAVEEGRVVYRNLAKAILLLLSTGLAEVAVLVLAVVAGLPLPFASVQILWNNVVTEGTITVNLVMEPREGDEMRRPPIPRDQPILAGPLLRRLALMSAAIVAVTLGFFAWSLARGVPFAQAQTATFTLLAVCEWFNVLNCRSETRSALRLDPMRNPWLAGGLLLSVALQALVVWFRPLGRFFHTVPLSLGEVATVIALGSLVLWVEEARKLLARRRARRQGGDAP
jgi:Ca2+-transporting ATPase